ncbi:GH13003 [Drosophila grimshawi]|uniref:GH13003 n=2 Tax=Drosophila grimshawi TaxID=7222 RepID=B4JP57_DROGR|nr:GH13003 [Drosophila grimshawi]
MSSKYALIFALAALCCLVAAEAATQRRHSVVRDEGGEVGRASLEVEDRQEVDQELEHGQEQMQANENRNTVDSNKPNREVIERPSSEDARARRVIRRGGSRRGRRNNRRRRGGRRRGGRRGGRRRSIRRRG